MLKAIMFSLPRSHDYLAPEQIATFKIATEKLIVVEIQDTIPSCVSRQKYYLADVKLSI